MTDTHISRAEARPGPSPGPEAPDVPARRSPVSAQWLQAAALPVCWVILLLSFAVVIGPQFLERQALGSMLGSQTVLLILALGVLVPLTSGDFDLSIASTLTFSGVTLGVLNVNHGWSMGASVAVALASAVLIGVVNGLLVVLLDLDSFIVTLASATFLTGLVLMISDTSTITGIAPEMSQWLISDKLFDISMQFYYGLILAALVWYVLSHTSIGMSLLFVGRNRSVARLSGIRVKRVRIGAFVCSGAFAGLAGVFLAGGQGGISPTSGASFLLPAYAAAFLGATAIRPGRFNVIGTVVAVYFLVTGITGLQQLGAEAYVQQLFYGGALIVAVVGSRLVTKK